MMRGKTVEISDEHHQLLTFIVKYLRTFKPGHSRRSIIETLILTYGKQLVTGVVDGAVRGKLLALINQAEEKKWKHITLT